MPQIELDKIHVIISCLPEIAEQLKIANKLKALELKLKYPTNENIIDLTAEGN